MILVTAAGLWLIAFLACTLAPRLAPGTRRNAQLDLLALGALGILTAGFFWQLLFTSNAWMPAGGGDLAGFLYPTYHFAQEWLTRGILPLWNPYIFGGTPFLADIQTAIFYPFNLLTYFLSNPLAFRDLEYLSVLHFYLAGAGMYALLRYGPIQNSGRNLNRLACLAGALAFEFSDLFITHFGNLNLIAAAAWLPLIFLFFARALESPLERAPISKAGLGWAVLSGSVLALSFFAGHIQPYLFSVLVLALYAAYRIFLHRAEWKRNALTFVITLGVAAGLSAITLLPALELTRLSVRSAFTYADAAQFSLPPLELVGMFVPGFFGRGPQNAWGPWQRVEVGYLGVFPLILAGFALILRRNAKTMFFVLLALVGLLLALGGYAILHGWLYQFVPGFGPLRAPARFVFVMDFGLAVLAAIGFDALLTPMTEGMRQSFRRAVRYGAWVALIVTLVGGALALGILILGQGQDPALFERIANAANGIGFFILLLAFAFALLIVRTREWLAPRVWGWLALALIFFDLFSLGAYVDVGTSDPTLGYQRADVVQFLQAQTGLARIDSRTDVEGLWRPDTGLLHRLQDVYGDNPLVLNDFNTYWESLGGRDSTAYQLLNVKYALARRGTPMPQTFVNAFEGGGGITVWENRCTVPRAWVVYNARVIDDRDSTLRSLNGSCLVPDPRVPAGVMIQVTGDGARDLRRDDFLGTDPITLMGYGPNEILGKVNARFDGYLFFSEVFAPGWRAFVDGVEAPVVRANFLFRAVPVTPGEHHVRLVYDPPAFKFGALVSGITLVVVCAVLVWIVRGIRSQARNPPSG